MAEAVGVLEVYGLATAFVAADAGCKAANVRIEPFDSTKPAQDEDDLQVPLWVTVKFRGSVADVTEAIEAGVQAADQMAGVVRHYVIPNPTEGTEKMLKFSGLDKE
jgi:microcompartment protein CcmL/EutN